MQIEERSLSEGLPESLDQALVRLKAGESVEACLTNYPQHAPALEPLLRVGSLVRLQAATPLPSELEDWLSDGAREFAALAEQMAPRYARRPRRAAAPEQPTLADVLDRGLARVRSGDSIGRALAEHPQQADNLRPLLQAGALLRAEATTALPPDLEAWLSTGAREFAAIAEHLAPRAARRKAAARPITMRRAAIAIAVVVAMTGAVDTVSAQSIPGDTLYPWKRARENISLVLATDAGQRARLQVEYAGRRLDELHSLVNTPNTVDSALVLETVNSLLDSVQGAIAEDRRAPGVNVAGDLSQLLTEAQTTIDQASTVAPLAAPDLSQASARVDAIALEIPEESELSTGGVPTEAPTPSTSPGSGGAPGGGVDNPTATASPGNTAISLTVTPTSEPSLPGTATPVPIGSTATVTPPVDQSGITPTASAGTVLTSTVVPPTGGPTDTPVPPTDTPVPPTDTPVPPTDTPVPTATPVPVTEQPTEPPPPTLPATTRSPRATPTPTDVPPTATPTDVPPPTDTPTNVPPPTDTPTDVPPPTDTPTDVPPPTDTPTNVPPPTETPTP
ncbi:MAG: hypothetical protein IPO81_06755 [Kouleothrix sp.]|nr:hypothetical protein [Kouleothrix sp.]